MKSGVQQVLEQLEQGTGLTDGQLLTRFISARDEGSFAALVRRHGPMVLGICRRVLRNHHDAEDAFQATFLVLARKATAVLKRESVGCWLHGVAYHTAMRAGAAIARRGKRERQVDQMPHPQAPQEEPHDWLPLLDRELNRLPEKYRAAIVVCDLQGKSRKEAADLLRVPEGTLSSRLTVGRRILAKRLARSGLAPASGVAITQVPSALASSTVKVACGQLVASTTAVALTNEVVKIMLMKKLRVAVGGILLVVTLGVVGLGYNAGSTPQAQAGPPSELDALRRENELLKLNLLVVLEKVRAQETELQSLRESTKPKRVPGFTGGMGPMPGPGPGMGSPPGVDARPGGEGRAPTGVASGPMAGAGSGMPGAPSGFGPSAGSGEGESFPRGTMPPGGMTDPMGTSADGGGLDVGGSFPGSAGRFGGGSGGFSRGGGARPPMGASGGGSPMGTRSDPVGEAEAAVKALRAAKDKDSKRRATEQLDKAMKKLKESIK